MTGVVKPQGMTNSNVPTKMLAGSLLADCSVHNKFGVEAYESAASPNDSR